MLRYKCPNYKSICDDLRTAKYISLAVYASAVYTEARKLYHCHQATSIQCTNHRNCRYIRVESGIVMCTNSMSVPLTALKKYVHEAADAVNMTAALVQFKAGMIKYQAKYGMMEYFEDIVDDLRCHGFGIVWGTITKDGYSPDSGIFSQCLSDHDTQTDYGDDAEEAEIIDLQAVPTTSTASFISQNPFPAIPELDRILDL